MNREIKFRAWDKNRKSMIDWFTMSQSTWNKGVTTLMYDILVSNKMNFDLMEYTGLKDKNGKEIYEGDIVDFDDYDRCHEDEYINRGAIEYDETEMRYSISNRNSVDMEDIDFSELEILGNIYENPELINS